MPPVLWSSRTSSTTRPSICWSDRGSRPWGALSLSVRGWAATIARSACAEPSASVEERVLQVPHVILAALGAIDEQVRGGDRGYRRQLVAGVGGRSGHRAADRETSQQHPPTGSEASSGRVQHPGITCSETHRHLPPSICEIRDRPKASGVPDRTPESSGCSRPSRSYRFVP